ncbi:hypothetical protein FFF34_006535 [Inquilinus sp. KBS0705]|nr:hypothetical protein FFF34_006535 [Inquilinus sp. KBS0705]
MPLINKLPNADAVLIAFIKCFNPSIRIEQVTNELDIHPDYPNLLALNDVLDSLGIHSSAYRISPADIAALPRPFIAHTTQRGTEFLLVHQYNDEQVIVTDQNQTKFILQTNSFLDVFDGVVLVPDDETKPVVNIKARFDLSGLRYPLAYGLLLLAFAAILVSYPLIFTSWQLTLIGLCKTVGLIVSVLLLIQGIDKNNPFIQTLCGGGGKANCNAILSSKAANAFSWLSWSEVGFFYFAGTWLTLLFTGSNAIEVLAVLNILSLPYTIYSIYYQARVARQWCIMCCAVQGLLWLEFFPLLTFLRSPVLYPSTYGWLVLFACFALSISLWLLLKPLLLKAQQLKSLKQQLRRFKYNTEIFNLMLKVQPKYTKPNKDWSIVLGNTEADNIITMVSNPYCGPCSQTHKALDEWLHGNPGLQARIIFTTDDIDIKARVARHLMALNQLQDKSIVRQALRDWYGQKKKSYEDWANAYPVQFNDNDFILLDKQKAWCRLAEVKFTPTLLINGYLLPDQYQINDIKYMLG